MTAQTPAPIPAEVLDVAITVGRRRAIAAMPLQHSPWVSRLVDDTIEEALAAVLPRVIAAAEARGAVKALEDAAVAVRSYSPVVARALVADMLDARAVAYRKES